MHSLTAGQLDDLHIIEIERTAPTDGQDTAAECDEWEPGLWEDNFRTAQLDRNALRDGNDPADHYR